MKLQRFNIFLMLSLLFIACSDELGTDHQRLEGYLYFNVSHSGQWAENGTRSDIDAPMLMNCDIEGAQPMYLHTEIVQGIDAPTSSAPVTRGNRYTGPVFQNGSIANFGCYAIATGGNAFMEGFQISEMIQDGTVSGSPITTTYWYTKDYDANGSWPDGETATFYGYAPYFTPNVSSNSNGLRVYNNSGVPTIEYIVPADGANQIDVLTAKHTDVSKGSDVELVFDHVLSAVKFSVKNTTNIGTNRNDLTWSDGLTTYYVTISSVAIKGAYGKGTWNVGDQVYASGGGTDPANNWTVDTSVTNDFTISPAKDMKNQYANVELNPDDSGNVFMMLPQTTPNGTTLEITCTMRQTSNESVTKTVKFNLALNGKTWKPGYTYNYTLALSDVAYVFDFNEATSFNATGVPTTGKDFDIANNTNSAGFVIRSYKVDANGNKKAVSWKLQHKEILSSVTGSTTSASAETEVWEDGSNGWMHLIDNDGNGTEVAKELHPGAYWNTATNQPSVYKDWYYRLEIGSILTPVIDLSMYNYDQTKKWKGRSTANCYIVAGPGTYRIPLVYGNAITNGTLTESAYNPQTQTTGTITFGINSARFALNTFLNYNDDAITSPYIKKDVGSGTYTACLVWEEGDGSQTTSLGATAGSGTDAKYGHAYNNGTVVKVFETIDTYNEATDKYNTDTTVEGKITYESGADYLQFEVSPDDFNYGNAVVGLRMGSTIVWSWHIWITDPSTFTTNQTIALEDNHSVTLAGRNIGWIDGGTSVPQKTRTGNLRLIQDETDDIITIDATQIKCNAFTSYFTNLLYQFGRKDPMRGNVDAGQDNSVNGSPRGNAGIVAWNTNYRTTGNEKTIGYLIQHPNEICASNGDLYPSSSISTSNKSYCNLWAAYLSETYQSMWGTWQVNGKTIYDPSPVGYIVPPSRYLVSLARNGYRSAFAEKTRDDTPPIICDFTHGSDHAKFYASGIRSTTNGRDLKSMGYRVPGPALLFLGALGHYHTSTPYSRDENYQLHLNFYGGDAIGDADEIDTHVKMLGDHAEALSVIPMVYHFEQNLTEEEEPREDPQQNTNGEVYPSETLSRRNNSRW